MVMMAIQTPQCQYRICNLQQQQIIRFHQNANISFFLHDTLKNSSISLSMPIPLGLSLEALWGYLSQCAYPSGAIPRSPLGLSLSVCLSLWGYLTKQMMERWCFDCFQRLLGHVRNSGKLKEISWPSCLTLLIRILFRLLNVRPFLYLET